MEVVARPLRRHFPEAEKRRILELNAAGKMDREITNVLNTESVMSARGVPLQEMTVNHLRKRWDIPTVKINGVEANPLRWPDGSYSVQGAATALDMTTHTMYQWLGRGGRLQGHQLTFHEATCLPNTSSGRDRPGMTVMVSSMFRHRASDHPASRHCVTSNEQDP